MIILVLAVFAFLSTSSGGFLYYYSFRKAAFQKTEADTHSRLQLLTDQLSFHLSEHIKPVKTLASLAEMQAALENTNLDTIYQANLILDKFTKTLDIRVSYLMDRNGVTICSSNRNDHDSFVGKDFSFRPYYKKAISGKNATYLALGTTSLKRGVYHSYPVFSSEKSLIIGVAVIKASIEFVETKLFLPSGDPLFFVSPNGIIFISNHDRMRFKVLWKPDDEHLEAIEDTLQFGIGPWQWSGYAWEKSKFVIDREKNRYIAKSLDVANFPGWLIVHFRNYDAFIKQVSQPFVKIIGPVILAVLILAGTLASLLYQLGVREITKRKKAEKKLRLSEERYRHIYHKTPVMLHSIDTEGRIIRVSDHWVEVMGYNRQEVIGKPLIRFFSPESKEYALDVVFPEFFRTGFCKDVAYTYVKKNNETIDILLSCYGVRDDNGQIVRSLAVSVDVTEKNRTQKDLQIAKEKLSLYSQNLELQVQKRTAQLEKTQENLKNLSKNIIASQEREKALVAGELHDHLGQVLTALRIDAVWIEKKLQDTNDPVAGERVSRMCSLIDETISDVRNMAYRLRPRVLDDLGLADALESLVADFESRSNVSCVFKEQSIPKIHDTVSTALYRIGQEALTNALKHSNATLVTVELGSDNEGIVLVIEDNGCGFTFQEQAQTGFGLKGMKERANLVGGRLDIVSVPGKGTSICCKIKVKG